MSQICRLALVLLFTLSSVVTASAQLAFGIYNGTRAFSTLTVSFARTHRLATLKGYLRFCRGGFDVTLIYQMPRGYKGGKIDFVKSVCTGTAVCGRSTITCTRTGPAPATFMQPDVNHIIATSRFWGGQDTFIRKAIARKNVIQSEHMVVQYKIIKPSTKRKRYITVTGLKKN
jgi:hypothetical protein